MAATRLIVAACCLAAAWAQQQQQQQYTTPVPILKQINKQNEDGSYSYGYEGADGSYKIETKHATGEVYGKYGYVDDSGSLREIEYGANKLGFQPAGTGINVAPPTIPDPDSANSVVGQDGVDDGQYREDPSMYYKDAKYNQGAPRYSTPTRTQVSQPAYTAPSTSRFSAPSASRFTGPAQQQPSWQQQSWEQPAPVARQSWQQPAPVARQSWEQSAPVSQQSWEQPAPVARQSWQQPAPVARQSWEQPAPVAQQSWQQPAPQPSWQQRSWQAPAPAAPVDQSIFRGHPATNFDVYTGSYSVNYK